MSTRVVAQVLRNDPPGAPVKHQKWSEVVLMHWSVPASSLRPLVPLRLDTYLGQAWLTIVACEVAETRSLALPRFLGSRHFFQVSLRTYVSVEKKPGLFFLSLDVDSSWVATRGRWSDNLPYRPAFANVDRRGSATVYHAQSKNGLFELGTRFLPKEGIWAAAPGSLPHFLTERYYIYSRTNGITYRRELHHRPWPLQSASAEITLRGLPEPVQLPRAAPLLHYCHALDVRFWPRQAFLPQGAPVPTRESERGQRLF